MVWFKVDDSFYDHKKADAAGNAALGLWVRLGSYCAKHKTDGLVPPIIASRYGTRKEIVTLINAGLILEGEGGYWLSGYLDVNHSADEIEVFRANNRERQREWKTRRRVSNALPNTLGNALVTGLDRSGEVKNQSQDQLSNGKSSATASATTVDCTIPGCDDGLFYDSKGAVTGNCFNCHPERVPAW